jgi:hypothetical protein
VRQRMLQTFLSNFWGTIDLDSYHPNSLPIPRNIFRLIHYPELYQSLPRTVVGNESFVLKKNGSREQEARHVLLTMPSNPSLATAQFRVGINLLRLFC